MWTGDGRPDRLTAKYAQGADVFVTELQPDLGMIVEQKTGVPHAIYNATIDLVHTDHYATGYVINQVQPRLGMVTHMAYDHELVNESIAGIRQHWKGLFCFGAPDGVVVNVTRDAIWTRQAVLPDSGNFKKPATETEFRQMFGGQIPQTMRIPEPQNTRELASPVAVVSRIIHHTRVTLDTLLGSICVYVLIGLVFTCADIAVQLVSGTSYFAQPGSHGPPDFIYFSFITMTTVGYGDLSPAHGLPRTMAVLEALTGQIFLVVMVSRLVALFTPMQRGTRLAMRRAQARGMDPQTVADDDPAVGGPNAGRDGIDPAVPADDADELDP